MADTVADWAPPALTVLIMLLSAAAAPELAAGTADVRGTADVTGIVADPLILDGA